MLEPATEGGRPKMLKPWRIPTSSETVRNSEDATGLSRRRFTVAATRGRVGGPDLLRQGCHGLVPWRFTVAATRGRVGGPDLLRQGCHGLVPWRLTLAANAK